MPNRSPLVPMIVCENVDKVYDYFTSVLGFAGQGKMAGPDGATMHAEVSLPTKNGEAYVMLGPKAMMASSPDTAEFGQNLNKGPLGNGVLLYFTVGNVDRYFEFINKNGAIIDEPLADQMWGDRTISVLTPDGYYMTFATPIKGFKPEKGMMENMTGVTKATAPGTAPAKTAKRSARAGKRTTKTTARRTSKKTARKAGKAKRR